MEGKQTRQEHIALLLLLLLLLLPPIRFNKNPDHQGYREKAPKAPVWHSKGLIQTQLNLGALKLYRVTIGMGSNYPIVSVSCPQASDVRNYLLSSILHAIRAASTASILDSVGNKACDRPSPGASLPSVLKATAYAYRKTWPSLSSFPYYFFFKILCIYFQRKGERKRGTETSMCGCLSRTPYWGPGPQPRHVP